MGGTPGIKEKGKEEEMRGLLTPLELLEGLEPPTRCLQNSRSSAELQQRLCCAAGRTAQHKGGEKDCPRDADGGGAIGRTRTVNLPLTTRPLYLLSYDSICQGACYKELPCAYTRLITRPRSCPRTLKTLRFSP